MPFTVTRAPAGSDTIIKAPCAVAAGEAAAALSDSRRPLPVGTASVERVRAEGLGTAGLVTRGVASGVLTGEVATGRGAAAGVTFAVVTAPGVLPAGIAA